MTRPSVPGWPLVSLLVNAVLLGAAAAKVRAIGLPAAAARLGLRATERPDFEGLARQRFTPASPGEVAFIGDSQVQEAPLHDMFGQPHRNRGISGARLGDLEAWLDQVLAERPRHLVVVAGSNDAWFDVPTADSVAAAERVLARIDGLPGCGVTLVSVPPVTGHEAVAAALNAELAALAGRRGASWVDLDPVLGSMSWTEDGLHLSGAAYHAVAPLIAATLASG